MKQTTSQLIAAIRCSDDLDFAALHEALRQREQQTARVGVTGLLPGDTVTLSDEVRPVYLRGLAARVVRVNVSSVTVAFPDRPEYGRFRAASSVRVPVTFIKVAP